MADELNRRLVEAEILVAKDDIFFLTSVDIKQAIRQRLATKSQISMASLLRKSVRFERQENVIIHPAHYLLRSPLLRLFHLRKHKLKMMSQATSCEVSR